MDNLEIILENFPKEELDRFISDGLKMNSAEVESSHFFDNNRGEDIEFHQIQSFRDVLSPSGTGNVFLKQLEIGCSITDVVVIFSFDEAFGDITFTFSEKELYECKSSDVRLHVMTILGTLIDLKDKFHIPIIRIGYEPASDDDTCLVKMEQDGIDLERAVDLILSYRT